MIKNIILYTLASIGFIYTIAVGYNLIFDVDPQYNEEIAQLLERKRTINHIPDETGYMHDLPCHAGEMAYGVMTYTDPETGEVYKSEGKSGCSVLDSSNS